MSADNWFSRLTGRVEQRADSAFPVDAGDTPSADTESVTHRGHRALWIGLVVFLIWAAFAPLGQGIPATGFVKVEGSRKTIQHAKGGVVEEILVREGDQVEANQALVRLNPSQAQAQQGSVESQLLSLLAVEARLTAERSGADKVVFPPFLLERQSMPQAQTAMQTQLQLFQTRRIALKGEIAISEEMAVGLQEQIRGIEGQQVAKAEQYRLYKEELDLLKPLYEQGFVPRNRMFELERAISFLNGQRSDDATTMARVKSAISELKLKTHKTIDDHRKEVETQLTDVQRQTADLTERRIATQDDLDRVILRAPVAGTVVDLSLHTVGGVVTPGQKLMDVVPAGEKLVVEVQIPPHLMDNVHVGLEADVHFPAFEQTIVPTVLGRLVYVAADRMMDPRTDQPYFVGRVEVTPTGLVELGKNKLLPGMPADVVIKTGERSLLGYLLKPLLSRMQFAFRER